jgi:hypothetical protein
MPSKNAGNKAAYRSIFEVDDGNPINTTVCPLLNNTARGTDGNSFVVRFDMFLFMVGTLGYGPGTSLCRIQTSVEFDEFMTNYFAFTIFPSKQNYLKGLITIIVQRNSEFIFILKGETVRAGSRKIIVPESLYTR